MESKDTAMDIETIAEFATLLSLTSEEECLELARRQAERTGKIMYAEGGKYGFQLSEKLYRNERQIGRKEVVKRVEQISSVIDWEDEENGVKREMKESDWQDIRKELGIE